MTFEEACAFIERALWTLHPIPEGSPLGEAARAALRLEWALNEDEPDSADTIARIRAELVLSLAGCAQDELTACLAVGDAHLREAAILALGSAPRTLH